MQTNARRRRITISEDNLYSRLHFIAAFQFGVKIPDGCENRRITEMMQLINPFHLLLVLVFISRLSAAFVPTGSRCPTDWTMNEETLLCTYNSEDTANEMCESMNSQLFPIFSVKEQSLVLSLILRRGPKCKAKDNKCTEYWISIVESKEDIPTDKVQFWNPDFRNGNGPCVVIRIKPGKMAKKGSWKVEDCNKTIDYICSTDGKTTNRPNHHTLATLPTTPVPTTKRHRSIPRKYIIIPKKMNWQDAYAKCAEHGKMAFIINSDENDAVLREVERLPAATIAKCVDSIHSNFYGWIGGRRHTCSEPFNWMNTAGENWPIDYFNWKLGEPNCLYSLENCLAFTKQKDGLKWMDESCHVERCPLCETLD